MASPDDDELIEQLRSLNAKVIVRDVLLDFLSNTLRREYGLKSTNERALFAAEVQDRLELRLEEWATEPELVRCVAELRELMPQIIEVVGRGITEDERQAMLVTFRI